MKTFWFTLFVFMFALGQILTASNANMQICNQAEMSTNEPYIRISDYYPGAASIYAYVENKPEGTNFKWFIDGEDWQYLYQYPDDEGAAFDYIGSETPPSQPNWIWLEYIDVCGLTQRIFYQLGQ